MTTAVNIRVLFSIFFITFLAVTGFSQSRQAYYLLKVIHYRTDSQYHAIDEYLERAYTPALHRNGINHVGVFKTYSDTADRRFYVFVPLQSLDQFERLEASVQRDPAFVKASASFQDAPYNATAFTRMENVILKAFPLAPQPTVPVLTAEKTERVYELRSYEAPSERYFASKVNMFNQGGEIALFQRLNFSSVFYGTVILGSKMPNLMYMTAFNSKEDRDAHWKSFGGDPEWKTLSARPEYQHNVSRNEQTFVNPTSYSDY